MPSRWFSFLFKFSSDLTTVTPATEGEKKIHSRSACLLSVCWPKFFRVRATSIRFQKIVKHSGDDAAQGVNELSKSQVQYKTALVGRETWILNSKYPIDYEHSEIQQLPKDLIFKVWRCRDCVLLYKPFSIVCIRVVDRCWWSKTCSRVFFLRIDDCQHEYKHNIFKLSKKKKMSRTLCLCCFNSNNIGTPNEQLVSYIFNWFPEKQQQQQSRVRHTPYVICNKFSRKHGAVSQHHQQLLNNVFCFLFSSAKGISDIAKRWPGYHHREKHV